MFEKFGDIWSNIPPRKRIIALAASLAMFAAILFIAFASSKKTMVLLYAGLDSAASGAVLSELDQSGVPYEIRGSAILVPNTMRDTLRMQLASEGLPPGAIQGYEILDQLTGFGTTSQMFDAAYWRAKEGELARSILTNPRIKGARVHIAAGQGGALSFRRDARITASVTITTTTGAIPAGHARGLRHLVAAAVTDLAPEDVSIIDTTTGILQGDESAESGASNMEEALRHSAERLLEAHVGAGNAVVEISVERDLTSEVISERLIDPESRTMISTETEESIESSNDTQSGAVTVASNLPDGAAGSDGRSESELSESRTISNFEISETRRELQRGAGAIRRLTVAVLLNSSTADGAEPRTEAELEQLSALVEAAVGLDETRGDTLTLAEMPFEPLPTALPATTPPIWSNLDLTQLIQIAVAGIVSLILGLFVVRPLLLAPPRPAPIGSDLTRMPQEQATPAQQIESQSEEEQEDPIERLRRKVAGRQDEALRILQQWAEGGPAQEARSE
ncbi:flagellar basal-body MS-ring/collar protein FliF [Pelagovum sp. HNIBRBA483]|uniref:flagellar basal-body MS-ring/collar protein FliF n=1 Tax=Pelagovum sp. HNIBRBA483 TaxID=3233341 RepID=UPI0034A5D4BD